jgi:hypothetical protein
MSANQIEPAEAEVARQKRAVAAELRVLSAKANKKMGSPLFMAGVFVGSVALAYVAGGRSSNGKRDTGSATGTWPLVLQTAHLLVPLVRTIRSARRLMPPPPLHDSRQPARQLLEGGRR